MITKEKILETIDSRNLEYFDRFELAELLEVEADSLVPIIRVLSRNGDIQKAGMMYVKDWGYARKPGYVTCYVRHQSGGY